MRAPVTTSPRGFALRGRVWSPGSPTRDDVVVVVDETGRIARIGAADGDAVPGLPVIGDATTWVGPGVTDAHVHFAFAAPADAQARGVTHARDLGAPAQLAAALRSEQVSVAGPIVTAPGGYPSQSWGRDGFAMAAADPEAAREVVGRIVGTVDVVKVALEPAGGPVPSLAVLIAVVEAAHEAGVGVTAHALTVAMVRRALAAGVDELAHVPVEPLPPKMVDAIASKDMVVVSTLQTFFDGGEPDGKAALANAAALHAAGVRIAYGTDLGNAGTRPGVEPRELRRLADAGLGAEGALLAATVVAAQAHGVRSSTSVSVGRRANVVVLDGDPIAQPELWRTPRAVVVDGRFAAGGP